MFFLAAALYSVSNNKGSTELDPGYYRFEVIGALGGKGCQSGFPNGSNGGYPSKITANFKIKSRSTINVIAGSKPDHRCVSNRDYLQAPGQYGSGGYSASSLGGAGGGYSSLSIGSNLVAMAGGGGGGGYLIPGAPAGGYDINRSMSYWYYYEYSNCNTYRSESNQLSSDHLGQSAKIMSDPGDDYVGGAGGGGGYFGGKAGIEYSKHEPRTSCQQAGTGGSSWVNTGLCYNISIEDGNTFRHYDHGIVNIYAVSICGSGCSDCIQGIGERCTECLTGYYMYQFQCAKCTEHCLKCTSGSSCDQCENGYHWDRNKCFKNSQIPPQVNSPAHPEPEHLPAQPVCLQNTTTEAATSNVSIENIDKTSNLTINAIKSNQDPNDQDHFKWWIIAAIAGGVVIIAVIIAIITYTAIRMNENSVDMDDEEVIELRNPTNQVIRDNPLYARADKEEDPFKNDFLSQVPSTTFDQKGLKDIEEIEEIEPPNYDY